MNDIQLVEVTTLTDKQRELIANAESTVVIAHDPDGTSYVGTVTPAVAKDIAEDLQAAR